jgi:DNA-binding beta-propeller fold protein YncE
VSRAFLVVANSNDRLRREGEGYLSLIDPETGEIAATVPDGGVTAHEVAVSPDGLFAFAPIYGDGDVGNAGSNGDCVTVIDLAARKLVDRIEFGHGVRAHFGVFGPDGLLYVTMELDQAVGIIDPRTRKLIGTIPTGQPESHNVAISHDASRGYTSNVYAGTVSVLDVPARKLITIIPVAPPDPAGDNTRRKRVQRISISNDDSMVFTTDWTRSELVVISTATNTVLKRIALPSPAYGTVSTYDGHWLLAACEAAGKVAVIDLGTLELARNIDVPARPQAVLLRPDGRAAFVSCDWEQKIAVISLPSEDCSLWTVEKLIATGYYPDGMGWAVLP